MKEFSLISEEISVTYESAALERGCFEFAIPREVEDILKEGIKAGSEVLTLTAAMVAPELLCAKEEE